MTLELSRTYLTNLDNGLTGGDKKPAKDVAAATSRLFTTLERLTDEATATKLMDRLKKATTEADGTDIIAEALTAPKSKSNVKGEAEAAKKSNAKEPKAPKEPKAAKTPKEAKEPKGRASANKTIHIATADGVNPRRAGTNGWNSFEIVRKNDGLTYAAYIAAGGRPKDLAWDIEHGYVTTKAI